MATLAELAQHAEHFAQLTERAATAADREAAFAGLAAPAVIIYGKSFILDPAAHGAMVAFLSRQSAAAVTAMQDQEAVLRAMLNGGPAGDGPRSSPVLLSGHQEGMMPDTTRVAVEQAARADVDASDAEDDFDLNDTNRADSRHFRWRPASRS